MLFLTIFLSTASSTLFSFYFNDFRETKMSFLLYGVVPEFINSSFLQLIIVASDLGTINFSVNSITCFCA